MKPKDWLFANGHLKEVGRGRLSREHITLIEEAVRKGAQIEGYSVSTAAPRGNESPKVERRSAPSDAIADVPDAKRLEEEWEAHTSEGNVGMRTVCNICRCSLTHCPCPHPKVWIDYDREAVVYFKPRKSPRKRWW